MGWLTLVNALLRLANMCLDMAVSRQRIAERDAVVTSALMAGMHDNLRKATNAKLSVMVDPDEYDRVLKFFYRG